MLHSLVHTTINTRFFLAGLRQAARMHTTAQDVETVRMAYDLHEHERPEPPANDLLIVHGLAGSKQNWRAFCRTLAPKVNSRIYVVDLRNHGDSEHTSVHNYMAMAADINEFICEHKLQRTILLGHSMGAGAVMETALRYPDVIHGLIVGDMSPLWFPPEFYSLVTLLKAMHQSVLPTNMSMAKARSAVFKNVLLSYPNELIVSYVMQNLRISETGEYFWTCNLPSVIGNFHHIASPIASDLPPYGGRTMFICGSKSPFVDPDSWPAIQKVFPNSEIRWLEAAHMVHFEKPAEFMQLVEEFVSR